VRPGELVGVTAADFDAGRGTWRVVGKMGERHIGLSPQLVELSKDLARRHPEGTLFRNARGRPWSVKGINTFVRRVRLNLKAKGVELPKAANPYAFRHTYATARLNEGVPHVHVAKQLGHSPAMLHKHYTHLKIEDVLPAVQKIKPLDAGTPSSGLPEGGGPAGAEAGVRGTAAEGRPGAGSSCG
jgi:integrase